MAIGMTAALIGSAVLGAGSSLLSSSKNSKAIKQSTAAQTAATNTNNALQRDVYNQNAATLRPFVQSGVGANRALDSMLGLSSFQQQPVQQPAYNAGGMGASAYQSFGEGGFTPQGYAGSGAFERKFGYNDEMGANAPQSYGLAQSQPMQTTAQPAQANPWDGFKNYLAGSDYAFQFDRGANAVNSGYAGGGTIKSGAAMKALEQYRQGLQAGYRNEYTGLVSQQQGLGLSAAGAQAGVGMNYANATSQNNQTQANAASQAAIARANNSNALVGGLANIGGGILGYMGGRT